MRNLDQSKDLSKLDSKLARLWPEPGNGHGNNINNRKIKEWKGLPVISRDEWQEIAGLAEIYRRTEEIQRMVAEHPNPEISDGYKFLGTLPDWAIKELEEIKHEIRPEAMDCFPDDVVFTVFGPRQYLCPKSEQFSKWKEDYAELLDKTGVLDNGESMEWLLHGQTIVCSENRAIVNGLYFTADNSNYKF